MHIAVYGSGYLGTIFSGCLADFGTPVTCFDDDASRVTSVAQGNIPYYERNLTEVVRRNVRAGRLVFSTELEPVIRKSQVIFFAQDSSNYIEDRAVKMAEMASDKTVLVLVTPVPVGTANRIEERLRISAPGVSIVSHPTFFTYGCAVEDFNWPDRILLGTTSGSAVLQLKQIYRALVMRGVPIIVTNHETAELAREASTAFVARQPLRASQRRSRQGRRDAPHRRRVPRIRTAAWQPVCRRSRGSTASSHRRSDKRSEAGG
jgi:UDPglucose 6-dehydrogenase